MFCCIAWWLCFTFLSQSIIAQQSQDSYEECYNLTTTTHCFKTVRSENSDDLLRTFAGAINWCKNTPGYALAKIENAEVQARVEQFLEKFELTSDDVWIAANRSMQGQWTWVNNSVYSDGQFSDFSPTSPAANAEMVTVEL